MTTVNKKKNQFASKREVKWCPGCGDYAILSALQKALAKLDIAQENVVIISGIGCSGRLPYYIDTYGFHTLHGRAPAVATGLKLTRPELSVWIVTGDGDGLSIGANHLLHLMRRNINVNVLLINNQIYGLTKGQYSPTSQSGQVTSTSPYGTVEKPINPIQFALTAGASFIARAIDVEVQHLQDILCQAEQHQGTAFIEIYQNCHIFNADAFSSLSDNATKADFVLPLTDGEKLIYGNNKDKCIQFDNSTLSVVENNGVNQNAVVHRYDDDYKSYLISQLMPPDFPLPIGVIKQTKLSNCNPATSITRITSKQSLTKARVEELLNV